MKKRWIALLLALTMAASLFAGCTKKTETPVEPEQGQTEQEPTPSDENQTEPVTPQEPEKEDEPTPEEDKPDEPQIEEEPEIELTPEQKRRREIETRVAETEITARDRDFANPFVEEAVRYQLTQYLYDNWDSEALPVSTYFEDDDFRMNIYQNSLEAYTCALTRTDSFDERYVRVTADGAEAITPATTQCAFWTQASFFVRRKKTRSTRLYKSIVKPETRTPLSTLNGTTANRTSVGRFVIAGFTCVPIETMTSSGRPKSSENFGMRYHALKRLPKTLITIVPSASDHAAPFLESVA